MRSQLHLAAMTAALLAGCSTQAPPAGVPVQDDATAQDPAAIHKCDSSNIQQFVGQERSAELEQKMLQVSGASLVRWAPFGTAITMEFRADRLTVFLDEANKVSRISCS